MMSPNPTLPTAGSSLFSFWQMSSSTPGRLRYYRGAGVLNGRPVSCPLRRISWINHGGEKLCSLNRPIGLFSYIFATTKKRRRIKRKKKGRKVRENRAAVFRERPARVWDVYVKSVRSLSSLLWTERKRRRRSAWCVHSIDVVAYRRKKKKKWERPSTKQKKNK